MKLNYKKTFYVGMAFLIICLFWQAYDTIIPKILVEKFGMSQGLSGFVMALDNILSLFLLPLFGHLSDKTNTQIGRRTPYIIIGTVLAAALFVGCTFADNLQAVKLGGVENNQTVWNSGVLDDEKLTVSDEKLRSESVQIKAAMQEFADEKRMGLEEYFVSLDPITDEDAFNAFVKPAREAYAWKITSENPVPLIAFLGILLLVLLAMAIFRSPAVALMPDVTLKPLRSKANAIINLMGAVGGILVVALGLLFKTDIITNTYMSYTGYFTAVAVIMVIVLILFLWKVREPELAEQMRRDSIKYNIDDKEEIEELSGKEKLSKGKLISLLFLLASVFLWFMGYNAVTSKFSVYAGRVLGMGYNLPLISAQAVALIMFIPIGIASGKIGRKKTIMAGIILLAAALILGSFLGTNTNYLIYVVFILAGIGWAAINVNSYPMVVELSKGSNVGKYTGFYYTASMSAQILTPILSGVLMDITGMSVLFPYAAFFVILALLTMVMVRHGDSKKEEALKTGNNVNAE